MMFLDDFPADGKSQSAALYITAAAFLGAEKAFKNPVQVLFRDAHAIVAELHQDMFAIGIVDTGHRAAIGLAIFNGVINQVQHHLPDLVFVGKYHKGLLAAFFKGKGNQGT